MSPVSRRAEQPSQGLPCRYPVLACLEPLRIAPEPHDPRQQASMLQPPGGFPFWRPDPRPSPPTPKPARRVLSRPRALSTSGRSTKRRRRQTPRQQAIHLSPQRLGKAQSEVSWRCPAPLGHSHGSEDHRAVGAAKTEGIAQADAQARRPGTVRHIVKIAPVAQGSRD